MASPNSPLVEEDDGNAAVQLEEHHEREAAIALATTVQKFKYRKLAFYKPHPKQMAFHAMGAEKSERCFSAGNQQGKTVAGGAEMAMHLIGEYPDWWEGRRQERPGLWWVCGPSGAKVRDNPQLKLLGSRGRWGTGFIPRENIIGEPAMSKGTTGLVDFVEIKHQRGVSRLKFMSYDMDDVAFESDTVSGIWWDEEPSLKKYIAGLARMTVTNGICAITSTPLMGMSQVVRQFYPVPSNQNRGWIQAGLDDALHIPKDKHDEILQQYPSHERRARAEGFPSLGSGGVYSPPTDVIAIEPFKIPHHFARVIGLDLGGAGHPTAWVDLAFDRDAKTYYVTHAYRVVDPRISTHAAAIKARSNWIPIAWPHDAGISNRAGDGDTFAELYRKEGCVMLPSHAHFEDTGNAVEPGIAMMEDLFAQQRLRVFSHLSLWFEEYRLYHRKDGIIVKEFDDIMDATRYAIMMSRYARIQPGAATNFPQSAGMDYDPLGGI